jgi:hypothetical protein
LNERAEKLLDGLPNVVFTAAGRSTSPATWGSFPFNMGGPEQPPEVTGYDVAQVRDGRIALLYTLINVGG